MSTVLKRSGVRSDVDTSGERRAVALRRRSVVLGAIVASCVVFSGSAAPPTDAPRLGTNLDAVVDWGTAMPFTDLFKTSRAWISGNAATWQWDDGRPFDLDEHGWVRSLLPDQIARTIMLVDDITMRVGSGRWIVRVRRRRHDPVHRQRLADRGREHARPRRGAGDASSSGGLFLYVTATDPANHLRNIRVIPEAVDLAEQSGTPAPMFTPEFLREARALRRAPIHGLGEDQQLAARVLGANGRFPTDARWSLDVGVPSR